MYKQYLGDGVYAELEYERGVILTTNNGIRDTNTIVLGDDEIKMLLIYLIEHGFEMPSK